MSPTKGQGKKGNRKERDCDDVSFARKLNFTTKFKKSTFSAETRDKILKMDKKVDNPFDPEIQGAFKEFVQHVDKLEDGEVDLPEVSLLLRGATKIYTSQVDSLVKDIQNLVDLCTRTKKASIERKKPKKIDQAVEGEEGTDKPKIDGGESPKTLDNDSGLGESEGNPDDKPPELELAAPEAVIGATDVPAEEKPVETIVLDGDPLVPPPATDPGVGDEKSDLLAEEKDPLQLEGGVNGSQSSESENSPKKKLKNGVSLPPLLISCFEEWDNLVLSGVFDDCDDNHLLPPSLAKAIRASKRKLYFEDNIPLAKKTKDDTGPTDDGNSAGGIEADTKVPEVDLKPDVSTGFSLSQEFPSAAAASFSPEDQAVIQECINDLHYLPFTFGLSKTDLSSAFSKTVDKMSQVFKKNNVPVTRNMVKEASVIAKSPTKSEKPNGLIHPVAHNLGDIYNTFVKMCRQECESFITNTSVSIMERSKEKSFAESRANIRSMIAELQRNIVPKFARVPLMAENTPEFFLHVTNFEKKMKKILEEEAKKDEFDVRKYERDVLEVTAKESSELDRSDDFVVPNSPLKLQPVEVEQFDHLLTSPSTRSSFDGSQSSGSGSTHWVPLKHIFHHMKSFDRTETCRSFYAVLALLSYQNLDINYDQLYSKESAALIKKQLNGVSMDEELDNKFRRGVKICTSRCPDADKEEVFVAALTSESRDESFRHLLAQETRNVAIRDGALVSSSEYLLNESRIDAGIAESMADFVEETSTVFKGRLHGKKRKKKPETLNLQVSDC